jgi:hypothetical protein
LERIEKYPQNQISQASTTEYFLNNNSFLLIAQRPLAPSFGSCKKDF